MEKYKRIIIIYLLAIAFIGAARPVFAQNLLRVSTERNVVSVSEGNKILMRYRYRDVPFKPYVQELFSPRGVNILLDAPPDHLHHHALMYAVAVDGVNFWEEQQAPGRQKHVNFTEISIGKRGDISFGNLIEKLDWINPQNQDLLLKESRIIRTCKPKDLDATILCWQSDFTVPSGKESVTLGGSHYFGLGMRFVRSMDAGGTLFNSEGNAGEVVRGDEQLVRANWCAYTAKANGKTVTVAMFGHPDNIRHPTYWFTMTKPFAYLSATMNLYREPLKILSDKPLKLHYAVVVWDNRIEKKRVQEVYDWWTNSNK